MLVNSRKLLFFDYDGTLSYNDQLPSARTVKALNEAKSVGYNIFICTGRCNAFLPKIDGIKFDGVVAAAGARITIGDELLFEATLTNEQIIKYLKLADSKGLIGALEGRDNMILFGRVPKTESRFSKYKCISSPEDFFERFSGERINKFSIWGKTNIGFIKEGQKDFFVVDHGHASEYIPLGCSKSFRMKRVADYYGLEIADTISFGDSFNDLDMLKAAGIG
ncbi:MAG: HAD family hydrolase, partial [Oscillospiraceae bacterium]|nr:HAD family hydrolase [Oscillospiraceae bacterium]